MSISKQITETKLSRCCGSHLVPVVAGEGTSYFVCASCHKATDPRQSETNEPPVESVSQPKAVDGYLKEFDETFSPIFEHTDDQIFYAGERVKDFIRSSIESARREGYDSAKRELRPINGGQG